MKLTEAVKAVSGSHSWLGIESQIRFGLIVKMWDDEMVNRRTSEALERHELVAGAAILVLLLLTVGVVVSIVIRSF